MQKRAAAAIILSSAWFASAQESTDKCYAIAFSSGDETAAYQAGVLQGLIERYGSEQTAYTSVSGVSGGAVNAAILASYGVGQEADAAARMVTFWDNASNSKLYKDWVGGVAEGLLLKGGLYNDAPLKDFLATELSDITSMQRSVDIGITDVLNGQYVDFTDANLESNLQDAMFASFSYAGFFPPSESMSADWFDGSVIWDIDIFSAVNECLKTHSQENTVVDVVMTSNKTLKQVDASSYNSIKMLWRFLEISRYYNQMDGLLRAEFAYPNVNFRSIISPSGKLPSSIYPLNLSQSDVEMMVAMGASDAQASSTEDAADTLAFFKLLKQKDDFVKGMDFETFQDLKNERVEFADYSKEFAQ